MSKEIIKDVIDKVLTENGIKSYKIVLFGSRARQNHKKDSDWDILIITEKELTRREKMELAHAIRKILAQKFIPCDLLLKSEREVNKRKGVIGSVVKQAIKEGIIL